MNLTANQIDALKELINKGIGNAAGVLNTLLCYHVHLQVPVVEILPSPALEEKRHGLGGESLSIVQLKFKGPFSGVASLVFPTESAAKLVAILTEDEINHPDLDSIRIGTLTEVGNIVLNGVMGVIGNELEQRIHYSVPTYVESPIEILVSPSSPNFSSTVIWAQARFAVEQHQIDGDVILLLEVGSFDALLAMLNRELGASS
ncbi:MAG: chemotaxis protein CheC [Chloroflexota bacterium]|nr:chemotaxis protein CheC [Chloroflexota bacterium]